MGGTSRSQHSKPKVSDQRLVGQNANRVASRPAGSACGGVGQVCTLSWCCCTCVLLIGVAWLCVAGASAWFFLGAQTKEAVNRAATHGRPAPPPPVPVADDACPCICQQAGLDLDPGACVYGRECVFGHGWCRQKDHPLPLLDKVGTCKNSNCGGPIMNFWPKTLCSNPTIPFVDVLSLVELALDIPSTIKKALPTAEVMNAKVVSMLEDQGFEDLSVEVDERLMQSMA